MAEAFFRKYGGKKFNATSAGTIPSSELNPMVVKVMKEIGIDVTLQSPKLLSDSMIHESFLTVNMGCMDKESCPTLFVNDVMDWNISDPKDKTIDQVRIIRDQIKSEIIHLINSLEEHGVDHPVDRHHRTQPHQELGSRKTTDQDVDRRLGCEGGHEHCTRDRSLGVGVGEPCSKRRNSRVEQKGEQDHGPGHAAGKSSHILEGKRSGLGPMEHDPSQEDEPPKYVDQKVTEPSGHRRGFTTQPDQEHG